MNQQGWGPPQGGPQPGQPAHAQGWSAPGQPGAPMPQQPGQPAHGQAWGGAATGGFAPSIPSMPSPGQAGALARGFAQSMLDFKFESFITMRILGVLYGLIMVMAVFGVLGVVYLAGISPAIDDIEYTEVEVMPVLLAPFGAAMWIIFARVLLESLAVRFRMAAHLEELNAKTKA